MIRLTRRWTWAAGCATLLLGAAHVGAAGGAPLSQLREELRVQWRALIGHHDLGAPSIWTGFGIRSYFSYPRLRREEVTRIAARFPEDWQVQLAAAEWLAKPPEAIAQRLDGSYVERPEVTPAGSVVKRQYARVLNLTVDDPVVLCRYLLWVLYSVGVRDEEPRSVSIVQPSIGVAQWPGDVAEVARLAREGGVREPTNALYPFVASLLQVCQGRDDEALASLEQAASKREFHLHVKEATAAHLRLARLSGLPLLEAQDAARIQSVNVGMKQGALLRDFTRIAGALGDQAREAGDHQTAIRWYLGAFRLATLLGETGEEEYDLLVGVACQTIAVARFPLSPEESARYHELQDGGRNELREAQRYRRQAHLHTFTRYLERHGHQEAVRFVRAGFERTLAAREVFVRQSRKGVRRSRRRRLAVLRFAASVALGQFLLVAALALADLWRARRATAGPRRMSCLISLVSWVICMGAAPVCFVAFVERLPVRWWLVGHSPNTLPVYRCITPTAAVTFVLSSIAVYGMLALVAGRFGVASADHPVRPGFPTRPLLIGAALSGLLWLALLWQATLYRTAWAEALGRRVAEGSARALWQEVDATAPDDRPKTEPGSATQP